MQELVELEDVQGIIIKGYGNMPYATYLMLHFCNPIKTKQWLSEISLQITNAATSTKEIDHAINIAFTNKGVEILGVDKTIMNTFPREFEEGMVTPHRQRMLGDFGESDPEKWAWGGGKDEMTIHATLLVYAKTSEKQELLLNSISQQLNEAEISIKHKLPTHKLPENKEHFGFRDGIADPVIKRTQRHEHKEHPANLINPGEFIFGYENEYDKFPFSPSVPSDLDKTNLLQLDKNYTERKDLGRNGSMLVFRQMHQDVSSFWKFMDKAVKEQQVDNTSSTSEHLAAKMVGRWPDGSPLAKCPMAPDQKYQTFDNFGYAKNDFDGLKCPVGAHIRRTNPRDNFLRNSTNSRSKDIEKSEIFMKRFRILRRGRSYGEPLSPTLNPQEVISLPDDKTDRGLHFLCFNTSIGRQFELIQQTWVNNPKFAGLYDDPDPIIGYPEIMGEGAASTFTEQAVPVRKKVTGIPRFVNVKGGAYFFMPGIKALKFLSTL